MESVLYQSKMITIILHVWYNFCPVKDIRLKAANVIDLLIRNSRLIYFPAINGYIFGHPLNISMVVGDNIAFYIIVVGGGADVHSINFHGHTVTEKTRVIKNLDSVATLPGEL